MVLGKQLEDPPVGSCSANARRVGISFEVPDDRRDSGHRVGSSVGVDPRLLPPPIIIERTLTRVAGLAQTSQVLKVVGAAVLKRGGCDGLPAWVCSDRLKGSLRKADGRRRRRRESCATLSRSGG